MTQARDAVDHTSAISVQDVHFSYGAREAVRGVSFDVARGEVLGFLGPNGAGKSTTIKMLTGQYRPAKGRIELLGRDLAAHREALQGRIGVCFEEKNLYPSLSGAEHLRFFARLHGVEGLDVDALLARVGLATRGRDRVAGYSKGMRQRLMIARALVNDPEVLILDEPSDGLDPVSAQAIRGVIREQAAGGCAVLITTHDMWEADALADRVAFIHDGKLYALDTPERLKLAFGKRSVRVRLRLGDGEIEERVIDLDVDGAGEQLARATVGGDLLTIHTEEATLEDVFVRMTGRGLA
jgi:ABC-type multidrug transport system ATPase subunit